jgi:hypothetical protein
MRIPDERPRHRFVMNNPVEKNDPVTVWQRLMLRWEAAEMSYRTAVESKAALDGVEGFSKEREAAEAKALAELTDIKQQIDQLIAESRTRRKPLDGTLVVGVIERKDGTTATDEEIPAYLRKKITEN